MADVSGGSGGGFIDMAGNEWPTEEQRDAWDWMFTHVESIHLTSVTLNLEDSFFGLIASQMSDWQFLQGCGHWPLPVCNPWSSEWIVDHYRALSRASSFRRKSVTRKRRA